jgi:hypothetical protein
LLAALLVLAASGCGDHDNNPTLGKREFLDRANAIWVRPNDQLKRAGRGFFGSNPKLRRRNRSSWMRGWRPSFGAPSTTWMHATPGG